MALSTEYILSSLNNLYGSEVVAADVRAWCTMNDTTYQTVTKKLDDYKVGRGKWNLTVQEQLEQSYDAPSAAPAVEQNLIPQKDDTFVPFGNFSDIKKLLSPIYSTLRSSLDSLVMVRRSVWNKLVRNFKRK